MAKSKNSKSKPRKPYKDFPLTANGNGQWSKKIRGKVYYFGPWADPDAALQKYLDMKDDLQVGRQPRRVLGATAVGELVNLWLEQADHRREAGDITPRTFTDYRDVAKLLIDEFGRQTPVEALRTDDFARLRHKLATKYAPGRLNKIITVTRMVFRWGWESDLLAVPVKHGPNFKGASKRQMRERRNATARRLFSADEIRMILDNCGPVMKAMALLGINCGLGNSDLAAMREHHIRGGWLVYPRTKTAIERRIRLWPKTLEAIEQAKAKRPKPKDEGGGFGNCRSLATRS